MGCGKPCRCSTYREHLLSVGIAASAMPTRRGEVVDFLTRERALAKDADAYRRLRKEGLQPKGVDGSHRLEARADRAIEVETGVLVGDVPTGG